MLKSSQATEALPKQPACRVPRPKLPVQEMTWCLCCCQHMPKHEISPYIYSGPFAGECYPLELLCSPPPWLTQMLYTMYIFNRKSETQIFLFSFPLWLGLKSMATRKGMEKKKALFQWDINWFLIHLNLLCYSEFFPVKLVSYAKKFQMSPYC